MNYYLHRIGNHIEWSHPLLEHRSLLSIGWADIAASIPDFISKHQNNWTKVPETVAERWQDWGWGAPPRQRFGLKRFLEMEQDDYVIVPTWGAFHIYEVADNARLVPAQIKDDLKGLENWHGKSATILDHYITVEDEKQQTLDLGFFRRVKAIARDIPRDGYADSKLTSRMKVRQANVKITALRESIELALTRHRENRPINLRRQLLEKCASGVRDTILEMLTPDRFEELIAQYFKQSGASTDIPAKNEPDKEGDADIIATFESLKLIVYVQAKQHDGETNSWAVDQIQQYVDGKSDSGTDDEYTKMLWVISTAEKFSDDCKEKAKRAGSGKGVRLINGIEFAQMLLDTGIEHL